MGMRKPKKTGLVKPQVKPPAAKSKAVPGKEAGKPRPYIVTVTYHGGVDSHRDELLEYCAKQAGLQAVGSGVRLVAPYTRDLEFSTYDAEWAREMLKYTTRVSGVNIGVWPPIDPMPVKQGS